MNWYRDNKGIWKEIIEAVSSEIKISTTMIEKDIIQSLFLFELSKSSIPFVFKGGTSLSKVYRLINRFSEDIDLSSKRELTQSERKKSKEDIINIAESIGLVLTNINNIYSNHDYNKYVFEYDSLFNDLPLEIIVETSYFITSYPTNSMVIHNYVSDYCKCNNIKIPIQFDASDFKMEVQSLERTFIDKVFAICDYKIQDMQDRDSRHLYDIAKMYDLIKFDDNLKILFNDVRKDRLKLKNNLSSNSKYNINNLLREIYEEQFYKNDYNNITTKLLYEDYSYDKAIEKGLKKLINKYIFK